MSKFNRVYSLKVEVDDGINTSPLRTEFLANKTVEITLPYALEFEISRASLTSAQTGEFTIYGLPEHVRNAIQKDIFQATQLRGVEFRAGYDAPGAKFLALAFNGTVSTCFSYREGEGDRTIWVTKISAYDGGFQMVNGQNFSATIAPGQTASSVVRQLTARLPGQTAAPIIGDFPAKNLRGEVLFGNIWNLILQKTNKLAFFDNGQVKALNYNEAFTGQIPVISSATGLLGAPRRTISTLEFDMVFEPRLSVGQLIRVDTTTDKKYNRNWKVLGFDHSGKITTSGDAGQCRTSLRLWFTPQDLLLIPGTPVV